MAGSTSQRVALASWPMHPALLVSGIAGVAAGLALVSAPLAGAFVIFLIVALIGLADIQAGMVALVVIAPWTAVANVLIGGRWVALGPDALLIAFAASMLGVGDREDLTPRIQRIATLWLAVLAIAFIEMFNPKGLGLAGALEGYRAMFLPLLALPVGYILMRRAATFEQTAVRAIIVAIVIVALMGIRQVIHLSPLDAAIIENAKSDILPFTATGTNRLRAFSPLPGPFHFGLLMMIGITLITGAAMNRMRAWHGLLLAVLVIALGLNATRLNWMGTAIAVTVVLLLSISPRRLHRWLPRLLMVLIVGLVSLRVLADLPLFSPIRRFATEFLTNPLANTSYVGRILGWYTDIFPAIRSAPIFGYGTGMAKDALGPFTSHNVVLKILLEGGATLLIAYLALTAAVVLALWRRRGTSVLARSLIALVVGVHAAGMFAAILDALPANEYYWLLLGIGLAVGERAPANRDEITPAA